MNNQRIVVSLNLKRTIKIMKLTVLMLAVCLSNVVASTYAQTATLNVSAKNETLEKVLKQIEKQSEFLFFYNLEEINKNEKISINEKNANIQTVLDAIAAKTGLKYTIKDRHIVLTSELAPASTAAAQQDRKVTGTVSDAFGPVAGANVIQKGTTNGTTTDMDGNFSIEVPANATLQISFIGYIPQDIVVKNQSVINVLLKEDTQALEEVVVVGYGTMKKKDMTGAVSSVKMDDSPVSTVASVGQVLAGKAAGLQVNTVSAQPGGKTNFRIRGAASSDIAGNDPLIIIDGFPVSNPGDVDGGYYKSGSQDNILASINPNDIESVEVLKDASSTAIYGSRAGNGVIIITTKRGKTGAPIVRYSGTASVQTMARSYEMLDATSFMNLTNAYTRENWMYENKIGIYGGMSEADASSPYVPKYSDAEIANPIRNTDWLDPVLRTGVQTSHNVSINGGTENTQYMISGNFLLQDGVVKNNGMDRYSLRANLDQRLSKYVKVGLNLTATRSQYDNVPLGDGDSENASLLVAAARFNPLMPIRDENGDYTMNPDATFLPNPVSMLDITDKTSKDRLLGTFYIDIEPIKDLHIKGNFGLDRNYQKRKTYLPTTTLYGQKQNGAATIAQQDNNDYLMELTASYLKSFGDHSINALLGHSYQRFDKEGLNAGNNDFLMDSFLYNNLSAGNADKPTVGSNASSSKMSSFFARLNYTYKDRYLVTASLRADGSSNFADGERWGYFPSVALGWRFSEENFMENLKDVVSNAKLRLSYGETGNSNVGNKAMSFYGVGNNNIFGSSSTLGVYLTQLGNPVLTWETSKEWNVGLDLGFLNSRFNVTAEYFHRTVSGLLAERPLLSYNEVNKIVANSGKTVSQGVELTINTNNIRTKDFEWTSDFTFSLYRDNWKERIDSWVPSAWESYDGPMRYYSGYVSDGLVQPGEDVPWMINALPGQVKIKDINGFVYNEDGSYKVDEHGIPLKTGKPDGKLDDADKVVYGRKDPGFMLGLNNTLRWKNFDFNIYFYGQFNTLLDTNYKNYWVSYNIGDLRRGYNLPTSATNVWSSQNTDGTMAGFLQGYSSYGTGDYYMEKTWFIRCRNITLGYNIPIKTTKHILSNLRVYADVNNPFIFTNYDGIDPETDSSAKWSYPNVRSFSLGVDITF
ncbi:TonB-dependent receptor [Parabacteroides johnsonii]